MARTIPLARWILATLPKTGGACLLFYHAHHTHTSWHRKQNRHIDIILPRWFEFGVNSFLTFSRQRGILCMEKRPCHVLLDLSFFIPWSTFAPSPQFDRPIACCVCTLERDSKQYSDLCHACMLHIHSASYISSFARPGACRPPLRRAATALRRAPFLFCMMIIIISHC